MIVLGSRSDCKKASLDYFLKQCFSGDMNAITIAIERFGSAQAGLAKALGVTPQAVSQWVRGSRPIPPRHALAIEAATGVSRHDLRPDVFGPAPEKGEAA